MSTIDKRVVEMRFDNDQFESRASKTVGTLEKLKNALNFKNAGSGLDELGKSARNLNFNPLKSSVEGVQLSFSKMEAIAMTALVNITNKAIDAGMALAKNLTIDQLTAGWQKYADKTTAVQTIMAATKNQFSDTSEQMEYVNAQLDRLNWFTDETSYNFVDMVGNIGKFTSNGIALEDAATAMQGIATWAAVSGQNAGTASRAMYQLSQAMGTGALKLQDWMSIETANMATYEFKELALETATSLGILKKQSDGTYKSIESGNEITVKGFRESLKEGWLTSDVLVKVLEQYGGFTNKLYEVSEATGETATDLLQWIEDYREAGTGASQVITDMAKETGLSVEEIQKLMEELTDQTYELGEKAFRAAQEAKTFGEAIDATKDAVSTGWMQTFEIIFGDYEVARKRWTALANELWEIFASGAEARNELLEEALGIPDSLRNENVSSWQAIQKAIEDAGIPLEEFIARCLKLGGKDSEVGSSFEEFIASLKDGWLTGDIVSKAIDSFIGPVEGAGEAVSGVGHTFEDFQRIVYETINGNYGWGNGEDRMKAFTAAGWECNAMQRAVNKALEGGMLTMEDYQAAFLGYTDEQLASMGYTDEQIKQLRELQEKYKDLDEAITDTEGSTEGLRTGSDLLFDGISQGWNAIKGIFGALKKGWDLAFPPMTAERLYGILESFNKLMTSFNTWVHQGSQMYGALGKILDPGASFSDTAHTNLQNITDTFRGLADILGIVWDAIKAVGRVFSESGGPIGNAASKILEFTGNIGRNITKLREWLKTNDVFYRGLQILKGGITVGITALKNWFNAFKESPAVQARLEAITGWFKNLWNTIKETFPRTTSALEQIWSAIKNFSLFGEEAGFNLLIDRVKSFGKSIKNDLVDAWDKLKQSNFFGGFAAGIQNVWSSLKENNPDLLPGWVRKIYDTLHNLFQPVIDLFKGAKEGLSNAAKDVGDGVKTVGDVVAEGAQWLKDKVGKLIAIFSAIAIPVSIYKAAKSLSSIAKIIVSPFKSIARAISNLGSAMKGVSRVLTAVAVVGVVFAISMLVDALLKLKGLKWEDIDTGVYILGGIAVVVGVLLGIVAKINKYKSQIDPKTIQKHTDGFFKILELAAALYLVVQAFADMYEIIKEGKSKEAITAAVGIIVALGSLLGTLWVVSKMKGLSNISGWSTLPILGIGGAVKMLVDSFMDLYEMLKEPDWDAFKASLTAFGAALGSLFLLMIGLSKMGSAGVTAGTGWSLVGAVGALRLMISVMKEFTTLDLSGISDHIGSVILVVGAFAALMWAMKKMPPGSGGSGWGVLALALAVRVLASAVKALGELDDDAAWRGTKVVAAMIALVGLFTRFAANRVYIPPATSLALIALTVAIGILGAVIVALTVLCDDAKKLKDVSGSLSLITGALAALVVAMGWVSGWGAAIIAGIAAVTVATALVAAIGGLLYLMITNITLEDAEKAVKIGETVILVCIGIAAIALVMTLTGAFWQVALAGLGVVLAGAVALGVIVAVLVAIAKKTDVASIDTLGTMFEHLGSAFGKLISGGLEGATSSLDLVAQRLADFKEKSEPFWELLKDDKMKGASEAAENMARAILSLAAAEFIHTIAGLFTDGTYGDFEAALDKYAEILIKFSNALTGDGEDGIDVKAIKASAEAGEALATLCTVIPKTGGKWQELMGTADIEAFATSAETYADKIKSYNDKVKDVVWNKEDVQGSVDIGVTIAGLTDVIPKTGGLWQALLGWSDIARFADSASVYLYWIKDYNRKAKGVEWNMDSIQSSVDVGTLIAGLANVIPKDGGLWQLIAGSQDIADFGTKISTYATAVMDYKDKVAGFEYSGTSPMYRAYIFGKDLVNLSKLINEAKAITVLSDFGDQVVLLAGQFSSFDVILKDVDIERLQTVTQSIEDMITGLSTIDTTQVTTLIDSLKTFATDGISNFVEAFSSPDTTVLSSAMENFVSAVTTALGEKETDFETAGGDAAHAVSEAFGDGDQQNYADLRATILAGALLTALANKDKDFTTQGETSANNYILEFTKAQDRGKTSATILAAAVVSGLSSKNSGTSGTFSSTGSAAASAYLNAIKNAGGGYSAGQTLANNARSGLNSISTTTSGQAFVDGFVNRIGLYDSLRRAYNAGASLGNKAKQGLNDSLAVRSPSREAAKTANYTVIGFVNALTKGGEKAYDAGMIFGNDALDGMKLAIAKISDLVQNDMDANPVITPVVDLTNATQSIQAINSMFNDSVGIAAGNASLAGVSVLNARRAAISVTEPTSASGAAETPVTNNFYNTFEITSNDKEEVARYVSRRIKSEVNRRGSQWA